MIITKPPAPLPLRDKPWVFLAGSIEQGVAVDWQETVTQALADLDVHVLNPRRDAWDPTWEQRASNPQFREQVEWELNALAMSDLIVMYFDPATKSPITLLELGLHCRDKHLVLGCPDGFWRKGNVEIVCERVKVPVQNSLDDLVSASRVFLNLLLVLKSGGADS